MKITISPYTQEILWGFWKMVKEISVEYQCEKCGEWVKITVLPRKEKKDANEDRD